MRRHRSMNTQLPVATRIRRHARAARLLLVAVLALSAGLPAGASVGNSPLNPIVAQIDAGHFKAAQAAIDTALAQPDVSAEQRHALLFQRERMRRILLDFSLSADDVEARVRKQIPDLTDAE